MHRATIVYTTTDRRSAVKDFYIHLTATDPQELEEEITETLADLKAQGMKARVCYT